MTDRERQAIKTLEEYFPSLSPMERYNILTYGEGMVAIKEMYREKKEKILLQ